jgi:hypothetical protein
MNVYSFTGRKGYQIVHITERSVEAGWALNGTPQRDTWIPCPAKICYEDDDGRRLLRSESPYLCVRSSLVFTEIVVSRIGGFLSEIGELLPLACNEEPLYIWHPLSVVDAIDLEASDVWRLDSGKIIRINDPVFFPDKLQGVEAFKIPQLFVSPIYFTDSAARILSSAIGPGLEFQIIWTNGKMA